MLVVDAREGARARAASVIDVDADSDTTEDLEEEECGNNAAGQATQQQEMVQSEEQAVIAAAEEEEAESDDDDDPKLVMVASSASSTSSIESASAPSVNGSDGSNGAATVRELQLQHRRRSMVGDTEKVRNSEFFTSIHAELLQTPQKASLKRPLALHESSSSRSLWGHRRASNAGGSGSSNRIEGGPHAMHSGSDMVVDEEEERKHEDEDTVMVDTENVAMIQQQQAEKWIKKQHHRELNFFMREPQQAFPSISRHQSRVCASRARICGHMFGRCELLFSEASVELVLWHQPDDKEGEKGDSEAMETRRWHGTLEYDHLQRFWTALKCHDRVDFVRCKSMAESFAALYVLFDVPIPDDEAAAYIACAVKKSTDTKDQVASTGNKQWRETRRRSSVVSALTGGMKNAVNVVSSFFGASGQQSLAPLTTANKGKPQTAESASTAIKRDSMEFFRQPASHSNAVVEIDDPSQPSFNGGVDDTGESQTTTNNDDDTTNRNVANGNGENANAIEPQSRAKTATLLTYPYGESAEQKNAGKISVTYGDIARLAPGEFLNDSIIDFYLRFLWRHLESWQQERVYIYSSHFFTQLSGSGALTPDERFARVSRWTLKESDLFEKRFLFIPINDSFHWSVAVFCNPGSAIIQKRRRLQQVVVSQNGDVSTRRRIALENGEPIIVDLVDNFSYFRRENDQDLGETARPPQQQNESVEVKEEYVEEELELTQQHRQQHPPCLLFLDSLRCHQKKKFTAMLREYLDCEWKSRLSGHENAEQKTAESIVPSGIDDESIVTCFDADSITLLEPEIPLQTNSSDCGVFLLMYAAEVLRRFPAGITREDVETNFSTTLTSEMFDGEHVLEFRDYLHQLIFCLQSLQKRGLSENYVKDEELDIFTIDR
ncbi:hypothetical protein FI667_g3271, partial [Globisporangium splendens]